MAKARGLLLAGLRFRGRAGAIQLALLGVAIIGVWLVFAADCGTEPRVDLPRAAADQASAVDSRFPAADRLIALGDVHGDLKATRRALKLGGLIDDHDAWVGGETVLVQTGDILDRGDDEQEILDLLERLEVEARQAGGRVHLLNGNHELMNVALDFRYVTPGGYSDFDDAPGIELNAPGLDRVPAAQRARVAAFRPGGAYATKLSARPVAVVVGDTVFAHGGVLPKHVDYGLDKMNREIGVWVRGKGQAGRQLFQQNDSPVWSRHFSDDPDQSDCSMLDQTLAKLSVKRMVVGHTPQRTILPACGEKVWRIDVGMAAHYGGKPEVLEITAGGVRALR